MTEPIEMTCQQLRQGVCRFARWNGIDVPSTEALMADAADTIEGHQRAMSEIKSAVIDDRIRAAGVAVTGLANAAGIQHLNVADRSSAEERKALAAHLPAADLARLRKIEAAANAGAWKFLDTAAELTRLRKIRSEAIALLRRAYASGHRCGWEPGDSTNEVMAAIHSFMKTNDMGGSDEPE